MSSGVDKKDQITQWAEDLGFDVCGVASPFVTHHLDAYRTMVSDNAFGDMGYLARHLIFKENPELLLPGVRSAIVVAKNYKNTEVQSLEGDFKVARYAAGMDYHRVVFDRLSGLESRITAKWAEASCYIGVDSRPLPERTLAILAGIGFKARNSMIIRPKLGSYFLLGVMLTTLELPVDRPIAGGCGTCRRCVDACPTGAIGMDGSMNYTACVSYQTIEKKSGVVFEDLKRFKGWIFGCDICQEVCPFNHTKIPLTNWAEFNPRSGVGHSLTPQADGRVDIPKFTPLYRSRKRVRDNVLTYLNR
ncbi:tRNA epoxyqueuosine(34) reductase QueG [bacterium]|nr:tRNA epoxyqueuosine(34) reductase QueG [bacterium]